MDKLTWKDRVIATELFHKGKLKDNPKWRLEDSSRELDRSIGRISEDLLLAEGLKKYPMLKLSKSINAALDYVRKRKREEKFSV